jgi:SAM-dependent methyltransferase
MTLRHMIWRLREEFFPERHPYDVLSGCDTSGMMHHRHLGPEATDYQAIDPDVFRATIVHVVEHIDKYNNGCITEHLTEPVIEQVIERADADLSQFTFVDLGCGKGRALLLAEEYDFKKIVGVDFAANFARIASRNAAIVGSARITVVHGDVREFDFPAGRLVVFLYNPFSAEITRSVMQRLISHPDTFYIAYVNPLHACAISSLPGGEIIGKNDWCMIWRFCGGGEAGCVESGSASSSSGQPR